jgi:long-subunit fatty acid transport protein
MLSGDIEYTDWTQLEFKNANPDLLALNRDIKEIFRATTNLRAGLEYDVKDYGVRLRGGFIFNPSPFEGDPSSFDQKYVTVGLGILMGETSMLDLAFARGWWETYRVNYDQTSRVDEKITTNNFMLTFSTRF